MMESGRADSAEGSSAWTWEDLCWLLAIGLISLTLRLGYALQYSSHPIGKLPWVDEGAYWTRAVEILGGHWLPSRPFYQDPLFPYALAGLMKGVGTSVAMLRVVLAVIGSATPMVMFLAARRGLGRAEGVVSGLIGAVYGPLIFTDGLLEKEGLAALVASMALAVSARAAGGATRARVAWMGVGGLCWGLLALLRANALLIGPLGAVWAAWCGKGHRRASGLVFGVGFAVAIVPSTIVNAVVGRPPELILTTWQSGANFYVGNGEGATGVYWAPDFVEANPAREADDYEAEAGRRSGRPITPGQVSRFWFAEGLRRWREAPIASVRLLAKKAGLLLHDFEVPDNQDSEFIRVVAAPRLAWGFLSFGCLAPMAALGLARKDRSPFWWLVVVSTGAGLGSTAAFFVVARYRIPWTPGLAMLAGAGVVDVARRARRREWWPLVLRAALIVLPVTAIAWRPIDDPAPDRWGHALIVLAMAELGESKLSQAIDAFDDARALGPAVAGRVGEITADGPVHDRLVALILARLELSGGKANVPRLQVARWLRQVPEGRDEARALLASALAENPDDRQALRELGAWWLGDPTDPEARARAAVELRRATREPGGDPSASILLAMLSGNVRAIPRPDVPTESLLSPRLPLARAILKPGRLRKTGG